MTDASAGAEKDGQVSRPKLRVNELDQKVSNVMEPNVSTSSYIVMERY
jgi:hypothetical protein